MPVFACSSCGRLLYRPEELLGRAWQCPNCGPTHVAEQAEPVTDELEGLLKKEYELGLYGSTDIAVNPLPPAPQKEGSDCADRSGPRDRRGGNDCSPPRVFGDIPWAVMVASGLVSLFIFVSSIVAPLSGEVGDLSVAVTLLVFSGVILAVLATFRCIVFLNWLEERRRRQWLKSIEARQSTTSSASASQEHSDEPDDAVRS